MQPATQRATEKEPEELESSAGLRLADLDAIGESAPDCRIQQMLVVGGREQNSVTVKGIDILEKAHDHSL